MESMNKEIESIKAFQRALKQKYELDLDLDLDIDRNRLGEFKALEGNVRKKSTIIKIPLDTLYFKEYVDDFLQNYNTVSIQKAKDCYWIKLEEADI